MKKWIWLAERFPYVELGEYCLMPNHFHGILMISTVGAVREPPLPEMTTKPLGRLIGAYKTVSTKWINQQRGSPGAVVWQRNYF